MFEMLVRSIMITLKDSIIITMFYAHHQSLITSYGPSILK